MSSYSYEGESSVFIATCAIPLFEYLLVLIAMVHYRSLAKYILLINDAQQPMLEHLKSTLRSVPYIYVTIHQF